VLPQLPASLIAAAPSSLAGDCGQGSGSRTRRPVAKKRDVDRDQRITRLPLALQSRARLELEMVVLDEDPLDAQEFLVAQGIDAGEGADPLAHCKQWLKWIREAGQRKLRVGYDDKGLTMDVS